MELSQYLIEECISKVEESRLLSAACRAIKAYEGENLPVPIKKTYFSFSCEENKVVYTAMDDGSLLETNDIQLRVNCFIPLSLSPCSVHTIIESVLLYLKSNLTDICGFTVGNTEYDSNVDAYRVSSLISFHKETVTAKE